MNIVAAVLQQGSPVKNRIVVVRLGYADVVYNIHGHGVIADFTEQLSHLHAIGCFVVDDASG